MHDHDSCLEFSDVLRWRTAHLERRSAMDDEPESESLSEWATGFGHGRISAGPGLSGPPANPYVPPGDHSDSYEDGWKTGYAFTCLADEIRREIRGARDAIVAAGG